MTRLPPAPQPVPHPKTQEAARRRDYVGAVRLEVADTHGLCGACGGSGYLVYSNTSTWRHTAGGSALTSDVCDVCWGSGTGRPWPSWRTYATRSP